MHFSAESLLWTLTLVSVFGSTLFIAVFFFGARNTLRTRAPNGALAATNDGEGDGDGDADRGALEGDEALPAITVLKPCAGNDDDLEACLGSYLSVSYPREKLQFIFGVRDERDAAWPVLQRLKAAHPELDIELVLSGEPMLPSPKISNVEAMCARAKHSVYWLSDSNTRVHPRTLRDMQSKLARPGVGLVASPISGDGETTAGAAFDIMELNNLAGVVTFAIFGATGICAAPGKSVLFRAEHLAALGGWSELGQYFGEDFVLMEGVRKQGLTLALGGYLVTNVSARASFSRALARHLRWTQIRWRLMPAGPPSEFLLTPVVPATALALAAPSALTLGVAAASLVYTVALELSVLYRFRGRHLAPRFLLLLAARPFLNVYLVVRGAFPGRVVWRGNHLYMGPRSRCLSEPALRVRLRSLRESLRPQA